MALPTLSGNSDWVGGDRNVRPTDPGGAASPAVEFGPSWLPHAVRRNAPALVLMALAITIPEFLTGSTPVLAIFVNPISLLFLLGLYGCGAVVIREVAVRWRKGWPSVLLLGGAYGILEEGFGTKTFFMSPSSAAGDLATFGHALGVSWVWVVFISAFHAVFSIALPILLVGLIFPTTRGTPFVRDRTLLTLFVAFLATVSAMFVLFDPSATPSLGVLAFFGAIVGVLVVLARTAPSTVPARSNRLRSTTFVGVVGGLYVWGTFGVYWLLPRITDVPALVVGAGVALAALTGLLVVREVQFGSPLHRLALASGLLSFLLVFSVVVELTGDVLALLATAAVIYVLYWIRHQLRTAEIRPPPGALVGLA